MRPTTHLRHPPAQHLPALSARLPAFLVLLLALLLLPTHHAAPGPWLQAPCRVIIPTPPNAPLAPVPPSFLGLSHEPLTIASQVLSHPTYLRLIAHLSAYRTGPLVIRWGGGKQDELNSTLGDEHWKSMAHVHKTLGVRYRLGLNLMARDPQLAVAQVRNALRFLPPESIASFGIGNEPDLYRKLRGFPAAYWPRGWFKDMEAYALALEPLLRQHFNGTKMITGPGVAWNWNWTFHEPQALQLASAPPLASFCSALTSHWYAGRATRPNTDVSTFLAEAKMNLLLKMVNTWVPWAQASRVPFYLEEINSLCEGGLKGASDTLGAALFFLDAALTLIKAGVSGMNWHGTFCYAYSPILFPWLCDPAAVNPALNPSLGLGQAAACNNTCGADGAGPRVGAPFYGMVFTQMALSGLPVIVTAPQGPCGFVPNVKVHALSVDGGAEMRLVLVKKDGDTALHFNISLMGMYTPGSLTLLSGPRFNSSVNDMTIAGQQIDAQGHWRGAHLVHVVPVAHSLHCYEQHHKRYCEERSEYVVPLPAAGAALMVVKRLLFM